MPFISVNALANVYNAPSTPPPVGAIGLVVNRSNSTKSFGWAVPTDQDKYYSQLPAGAYSVFCVGISPSTKTFEVFTNETYPFTDLKVYIMGHFGSDDSAFLSSPVSLSSALGSAGQWTTIDLSSHIPSNAVAVVLDIDPNSQTWGVRPYGSTDNRTATSHYCSAIIPCNDRKIEFYRGSTDLTHVRLTGYITSGQVLSNATNKTPSYKDVWTDITFTSDEVPNTNGVVLLQLFRQSGTEKAWARRKWSSVDFTGGPMVSNTFLIVQVDNARKIEVYVDDQASVLFYGFLGLMAPVYVELGNIQFSLQPEATYEVNQVMNYTGNLEMQLVTTILRVHETGSMDMSLYTLFEADSANISGHVRIIPSVSISLYGFPGTIGSVLGTLFRYRMDAWYLDLVGDIKGTIPIDALFFGYHGIIGNILGQIQPGVKLVALPGSSGEFLIGVRAESFFYQTITLQGKRLVVMNLLHGGVTEHSHRTKPLLRGISDSPLLVLQNSIYREHAGNHRQGMIETGLIDTWASGHIVNLGDIRLVGSFKNTPVLTIIDQDGNEYRCVLADGPSLNELRYKPPRGLHTRYIRLRISGTNFILHAIKIELPVVDRL